MSTQKMRVALLNFHFSNNNYGAVLQAAALQYVLSKINVQAENIDISIEYNFFVLRALKKIKNYYEAYKKNIVFRNTKVFEEFRNQWINRTNVKFYSMKDLYEFKFDYDAYIVGSDQVWRPKYIKKFYSAYFLSFVPENTKKIAYAASFGLDFWEERDNKILTKKVSSWLRKFDVISVREKSGKAICKELCGIEPEHVIDPTLLAGKDFFNKIIKEKRTPKQSENIVYYKLDSTNDFQVFLEQIEKILGIESENIYHNRIQKKNLIIKEYLEVPLFLAKIRDAKLVVTDSFHCICFAILFNKPFVYYPNENRGLTRVNSLFESLKIKNLFFTKNSNVKDILCNSFSLNYLKINKLILSLQKNSFCFLKNNLES
jgi:hypothetical protein